MKLTTKLAKQEYDFNKDSETTLLIELEAPKLKLEEKRQPICVVPVLDVSGSMSGDKIDYLKKACRKLIDHLSPGDFAGVVAYDTYVYEVATIREITQEQKEVLKKEISKLEARTATNLSGGLIKALNWLNDMDLPDNTILRVILFTDGQANVGIKGKELLNLVNKTKDRCTISCFGFGNDCSHELLADLSLKGDGNFSFIDSADAALTAFGRELGGLVSTYAQNIKIKIQPDKNNRIIEVLNDEDVNEDNGLVNIELRDILAQEKKWVVARVNLSKVEKPLPRKVNAFKIFVEYVDREGKTQSLEATTKVVFCKAGKETAEEDVDVVKHYERLLVFQAQEKANVCVSNGDFIGAQNIFTKCRRRVKDPSIKGIVDNLSNSYSSSTAYYSNLGETYSVRNLVSGARASYCGTSDSLKGCVGAAGSFTNDSMDLFTTSFTDDKEDEVPVITTTNVVVDPVKEKVVSKSKKGEEW